MSSLNNNINVVRQLLDVTKNSNIKWILTGSTALAMFGVDISVNDIDILTNKSGAEQLDLLLSNYCVKKSEFSALDNIRSYFGIYSINGIRIEVMGELQHKLKTNEWSKVDYIDKIEMFEYDDLLVPTLSLEEELIGYELMGRTDKVTKIKEFLDKKSLGL